MKALFFAFALTLIVFVGAFVWGLCTSAKAEDEAMSKALDEYIRRRNEERAVRVRVRREDNHLQ